MNITQLPAFLTQHSLELMFERVDAEYTPHGYFCEEEHKGMADQLMAELPRNPYAWFDARVELTCQLTGITTAAMLGANSYASEAAFKGCSCYMELINDAWLTMKSEREEMIMKAKRLEALNAIERERLEVLCRLETGTLHEPSPEYPDEWDSFVQSWYEGIPDYISFSEWCNKYGNLDQDECRTRIFDAIYGKPNEIPGWRIIESIREGGEAECPHCSWAKSVAAAAANGEGWAIDHDMLGYETETCYLCDGDGHIYMGEGITQVIYATTGVLEETESM